MVRFVGYFSNTAQLQRLGAEILGDGVVGDDRSSRLFGVELFAFVQGEHGARFTENANVPLHCSIPNGKFVKIGQISPPTRP